MKTFLQIAKNLRKYNKFNYFYTDIWLNTLVEHKMSQPHRAPISYNKPNQAI